VAEDRSQQALDHLQRAALELIAAVRTVLDVVEESVREPNALRDLVAQATRATTEAAAKAAQAGQAAQAAGHAAQAPAARAAGAAGSTPSPGAGDGGVEHIRIS